MKKSTKPARSTRAAVDAQALSRDVGDLSSVLTLLASADLERHHQCIEPSFTLLANVLREIADRLLAASDAPDEDC